MEFGVKLRVWGPSALFARPELKVEAVSYDVITPSAARGVVEAVYWKPQIRWNITRLWVLAPPRFASVRVNGVGATVPVKGSSGAAAAMKSGRGRLGLEIEAERQQMSATILRDVHYVIEARFELLDTSEKPGKHLDMFRRRAEAGQCFHRPYLGRREHECHFAAVGDEPIPGPADPLPESWKTGSDAIDHADRSVLQGERDLGYMLHDIDFANDRTARFFRATMRDGVIDVPAWNAREVVS